MKIAAVIYFEGQILIYMEDGKVIRHEPHENRFSHIATVPFSIDDYSSGGPA